MSSVQVKGLRYSGSVVADGVLRAIWRAGGEPVIVPLTIDSKLLQSVDGIVLPGGADINPARYGQHPDKTYSGADHLGQDDADARAIRLVDSLGVPALFICRGLQLWNVERGGSVHQHWKTNSVEHIDSIHTVDIEPNSLLAEVIGSTAGVPVSSYHHQSVDRVGDGLRVVARSDDACIEAIEDPSREIIAVQWHPEDRAETDPVDSALFSWIVQRAEAHRLAREAARVDDSGTGHLGSSTDMEERV